MSSQKQMSQLSRRPSMNDFTNRKPSITAMRRKGSVYVKSVAAKAHGTDRVTVYISMLCGLLGAVVMIMTTLLISTSFSSFADWTYTLLEEENMIAFSGVFSLILGMIVVVLSFLGGMASVTNNPFWTKVFFALLLVTSAVEVIVGLTAISSITGLDEQIQSDAATGADISEQSVLTRQLVDYSLALYDSCCFQQGQFKPGDDGEIAGKCNGDDSDDGTVCYTSNLFFDYFSFVVRDTDVCKMLSEQTVDLSGVTFKFGGIKIDARSISGGESSIALVGQPNGCGRGYARAFQYLLFVWFTKTVQPLYFSVVGCGAVQVLLVLLAYASMCLQAEGGVKQESAIDTYQTYMKALREQQQSTSTESHRQSQRQSQRQSYRQSQRQSQRQPEMQGSSSSSSGQSNPRASYRVQYVSAQSM